MVFTDSKVSSFIAKRSIHLLNKTLQEKGRSILDARILDPCVGGGSFFISLLEASKLEPFGENNIIGIDIETEAIELAKKNLREYGIKDPESLNIYRADFLDDFSDSGFDLIIGNPPYIGEKGNKDLFSKIRTTEFGEKYYEKGMDYFYYFIEKSLDLLNDDGILAMITPTYWTRADSASKLRAKIRTVASFIDVIDFGEARAFKDAIGHHSMIFFLQKKSVEYFRHYQVKDKKKNIDELLESILSDMSSSQEKLDLNIDEVGKTFAKDVVSNKFCMRYSPYFSFIPKETEIIYEKIKEKAYCTLADLACINQGIVSGADKVTAKNITLIDYTSENNLEDSIKSIAVENYAEINVGEGIFVLNEIEAKKYIGRCNTLVPFYKNSDISPYDIKNPKYYLFYSTQNASDVDIKIMTEHLMKYKGILNKRRECLNGTLPYYCLQWSRKETVFTGEKIVAPQRALYPCFAYSDEPFYASADVYFITKMKENPFFLLGYLNSSFADFYLRNVGKKKGDYLELYQRPLSEIPIITMSEQSKSKIAQIAKKLSEIKTPYDYSEIEGYKQEIYGIIWQEL